MDVLKERGGGGIEVKKSGQFNNSSGTEREREPNGMTQNNERQRNTNSLVISRERTALQHTRLYANLSKVI